MVEKVDPYRAFRFRLEIDGLQEAGFQSVGGLSQESKIEPYREGGVNDTEHQFVTLTTYPPLTLRRGLVNATLWDWYQDVIAGRVERKTVAVVLLDENGDEVWRWICEFAFPSKWTGEELNAAESHIFAETIEIVHEGLRRQV